MGIIQLSNIIIPSTPPSSSNPTFDITINDSTITSITPHTTLPSDSPPSLLLPTLCHPHIHLDKPYLLTCNHPHDTTLNLPSYVDLAPTTGTFQEALTNTSTTKARFTPDDLYLRGSQLLATAHTQGVTSARCFIEVDHVTCFKTLDTALKLKHAFSTPSPGHPHGLLEIQLCVFAQDPLFSTSHGPTNKDLIESALTQYANKGVAVLGSTPYVETTRSASLANISWAITTALKHDLHLDFHLDYSLSTSQGEALVWHVFSVLIASSWPRVSKGVKGKGGVARRTVVLGHCTALTNFSDEGLHALSKLIRDNGLPVHFVGLPTSDIYMMGRPPDPHPPDSSPLTSHTNAGTSNSNTMPLARPLGTPNIPLLNKSYGIKAVLGVNNVGNAFTPYGTGDPLHLASWGVGLFHAGTETDAGILYGSVSRGARRAVGLLEGREGEEGVGGGDGHDVGGEGEGEGEGEGGDWGIKPGTKISKYGMLLIRNEEWVGCPGHLGMKVPARQRRSVRDVVWDVPEVKLRKVVG